MELAYSQKIIVEWRYLRVFNLK